ncbi:TetR family transcriptional regulator C-terminal domain-containing protein [Hoeflea sp. TYP-13]|uniref:TetR family transcriptional regulator C-terminal domain-containing protein n=1 Tax=Hoeflea sp. TYP-13 TaxID=3230023 RepID=UPI0034C5E252
MNQSTQNKPRPRRERKDNADKRRLQLIDATLRSIVANGLAKTTLATVANEAGLSQGVAVFYFKTKDGLLAETLRTQYSRYQDNWMRELNEANSDPASRLIALIRADFAPAVCNPETLSIWFAFWGELRFQPHYAEISREFDQKRGAAIQEICAELMPGASEAEVEMTATSIDSLTDGLWQKLYIWPETLDLDSALDVTIRTVQKLLPGHTAGLVR